MELVLCVLLLEEVEKARVFKEHRSSLGFHPYARERHQVWHIGSHPNYLNVMNVSASRLKKEFHSFWIEKKKLLSLKKKKICYKIVIEAKSVTK